LLTVRYDWLGMQAGDRLLDLGCGFGRHAFEGQRRGAKVVACDLSAAELKDVRGMFEAIEAAEHDTLPGTGWGEAVNGDATALPFADNSFERIIASEILEHVPDDAAALAELARVLKPGGTLAVTVPSWLAERVCWALTEEYHAPFVSGGHVRIYTESALRQAVEAAGLRAVRSHKAHSLHTPYWWLKCALGVTNDENRLVRAYHQVLLWDITGHKPISWATRLAERAGNPVLGKSIVLYATKPLSGEG
jgi:SAM-dependent methyltransferase